MRKILVLLILIVPAWADWVEKYRSGEDLLAEGQSAIALGHLQVAAEEAKVAGSSDAQLAAVYDALGRADMGTGHYRDAKRHFERALHLAADESLAVRAAVTANLGQACQALGELARAEQLFRRTLEAMPERAAVWNLLGGVLYLQRRYEEAEDAQRRAMSNPADPASVTARNDLAVICEARGRFREAAVLYEQAISSAPAGQPRARMLANLGALYLKLGNPTAATVALGRSLEEMETAVGPAHPDVARVLEDYERVLRKAGRKAEARNAAKRAAVIRSSFAWQDNATRLTVDYRDLK
jgi:tetratricopeptide (TPR) repeat protein